MHPELATKGHAQETQSSQQLVNVADKTATVGVLEYGAIAATQRGNVVLVHPFVDWAIVSLETVQYQLQLNYIYG